MQRINTQSDFESRLLATLNTQQGVSRERTFCMRETPILPTYIGTWPYTKLLPFSLVREMVILSYCEMLEKSVRLSAEHRGETVVLAADVPSDSPESL